MYTKRAWHIPTGEEQGGDAASASMRKAKGEERGEEGEAEANRSMRKAGRRLDFSKCRDVKGELHYCTTSILSHMLRSFPYAGAIYKKNLQKKYFSFFFLIR